MSNETEEEDLLKRRVKWWEDAQERDDFNLARVYIRTMRAIYRYIPPVRHFEKREMARNVFEVFQEEQGLTRDTVFLAIPWMMTDRDHPEQDALRMGVQTAAL